MGWERIRRRLRERDFGDDRRDDLLDRRLAEECDRQLPLRRKSQMRQPSVVSQPGREGALG